MEEKEEFKEEIIVNEDAKKEFLEELKNKNLEETQAIEKAKILAALNESASSEEINIDSVEVKKDNSKNAKRKLLIQEIKASIIDTAVTSVISIAALFLFDVILRLIFGYYVADLKGVYIIIFLIMLIIYRPIMDISKHGRTIGQKLIKTKA